MDVHLDTSHLLCCVGHCCWDTILMFVFKYCNKVKITADNQGISLAGSLPVPFTISRHRTAIAREEDVVVTVKAWRHHQHLSPVTLCAQQSLFSTMKNLPLRSARRLNSRFCKSDGSHAAGPVAREHPHPQLALAVLKPQTLITHSPDSKHRSVQTTTRLID